MLPLVLPGLPAAPQAVLPDGGSMGSAVGSRLEPVGPFLARVIPKKYRPDQPPGRLPRSCRSTIKSEFVETVLMR